MIGLINPIRYRGYYYDIEISMYYLQSRYYDPAIGRFINSDDTEYIGYNETLLSYNIFAYCENNSINNADPTGQWDYNVHSKWIKEACSYYMANQRNFTINISVVRTLMNWQKTIDTKFGNNMNGNSTYKEPFHGKDTVKDTLSVITELFNLAIATKKGNIRISNISFHDNPQSLNWSKLNEYANGFIGKNYITLSKKLTCGIAKFGTGKGANGRNKLLIDELKKGKQSEIFLALALHTAMDFFSHVVPVWYTTDINNNNPKMNGPFKINSAVSKNKANQYKLDDNVNYPVLFMWRINNTKSIIKEMMKYYGKKSPKKIREFYYIKDNEDLYQVINYNNHK